ncbi:MAG: VWA domain-containing protein [Pirellulaceae bacterium]|nr:VWA domain-containing protein [Planctomycetales bacterium]
MELARVDATVEILEQVATTTLDIHLRNSTGRRLEAELLVPVPDRAVVRGLDFNGSGSEPTARLLPREEARRLYDSIVAKLRDPALLEFVGYNLIRSSVFPVEPNGTQTIRLTYESLLPADGERVDYVLPRSESLAKTVPWNIQVKIKSKRPIATVYSPSHELTEQVATAVDGKQHVVSTSVSKSAQSEPGAFRLSYLLGDDTLSASLIAYPDSANGGYFLLLAGIPSREGDDTSEPTSVKREVTLVLDRSGSMSGDKLTQVRQAAMQIIAGLDDDERFNIIAYNESVEQFSPEPVAKNSNTEEAARSYLSALKPRGGTNIHDALLEALRPEPRDGVLPIVLFLTDGRPTTGNTSEKAIRELATDSNPYQRRVFTFGVGVDVNSPLLENIAFQTRGTSTFVLPGEDIELKIATVFRRLSGPALALPALQVIGEDGNPALGRVSDVLPAQLPDLFDGDQLVLLGRYVGNEPVKFQLQGSAEGKTRTFEFEFSFDQANTRNAFVPRLWAGRKIGILIDAIRSSGADTDPSLANNNQELIDEIVKLSTEFGILTEYTSFLAEEGTPLNRRADVLETAAMNLQQRAVESRVGAAAVNQDINNSMLKSFKCVSDNNKYLDANLGRVAITTVRQLADCAFYLKGNTWIDSRLVDKSAAEMRPKREIQFGSDAFMELARRLAQQGRQASVALNRDTLLLVDGQPVLIRVDGLNGSDVNAK